MRFMLDTNLCIDLMRGKAPAAFKRLRALPVEEAGLSSITLAAAQPNRWTMVQ
ncbi:MAG TPA: hypothetical protein VN541_10235 [Tepidisphaeraceae bacterium]|nr:hypothetical protein [Tepidisphaeraceae bacterium]